MALNRQKKLQNAERLLKQGKVEAALVELQDLAARAPSDLLTMNRMGDLLAKQGRRREAIEFYSKIAAQFAGGGFLPKAIAIHKKILRLNPQWVDSLVQLGELYGQQKLPGEARSYLMRAADQHLQARNFAKAREVYEKLVAAEPGDPRHRARLAEARAAEGETAKAGEDLLTLADSLLAGEKAGDAEKTYRRAAELLDGRTEPLLGLARSLAGQGREAEALELLAQAEGEGAASPAVLGERLALLEQSGQHEASADVLQRPQASEIADAVFVRVFRHHLERQSVDEAWGRFTPAFQRWQEHGSGERLAALYGRLSEIEEHGHLPALERLHELRQAGGDAAAQVVAIEELARAYQARSMDEEAEALLQRLRTLAPRSRLIQQESEPPEAPGTAPAAAARAEPAPEAPGPAALEAEAPAVPLNRAEEELVTGRLTQAEILEKYGLREQAVQQVRDVTARFPGHVTAQERLVALLREGADRPQMRDALIGLALARRASGDSEGARKAAEEATLICTLDESTESMLTELGVLGTEPAKAQAPPETHETEGGDVAVTIDFDVEDETRAEAQPVDELAADEHVAPAVTAAGERAAVDNLVDKIAGYLERGEVDEARRQIDALQTLGLAGAEIESLRLRLTELESSSASVAVPAADDDDDLSAITAALENELFDEAAAAAPDPEAEQSLEEVFAAFKARVAEEVSDEDHRTHYDLGIAFKEMGLIDEAIAEFRHAVDSAELGRESCSMLALCHRERNELQEAAGYYERAIAGSNGDLAAMCNLRYELAEVLLSSGDRDGALEQFRGVLDTDPAFRDVRDRIAALESCST